MNKLPISFEFFPPKNDAGREKLREARRELASYQPEFFSVTYGAGGSTRETTRDVVLETVAEGNIAAPHLSFGGDGKEDVLDLLNQYHDAGIRHLVALRGDLPSGVGGSMHLVHANELVSFIREQFGEQFQINVAAYPEMHPEAASYSKDIYWLGEKFRAGASRAITQYFYSPDAYFQFLDNCQQHGIDKPIIPGIMPLTNYQNLARFSERCGAEIPRWLRWKLRELEADPQGLISFGIDFVTEFCQKLLAGGAPGLHFYTMNQWLVPDQLCRNLGFTPEIARLAGTSN